MRSKVVFVLLLLMFVGFGASVALRGGDSPPAAGPVPPSSASASAVASASALPAASSPAPAASARPGDKLMKRPLRVAALGWDLIAPGALVNQGLAPTEASAFTKAGLEVDLVVHDSMKKLEEALARGGGDEAGADVAIVPMPSYVAAYERLRALEPKVFLVVGWSKGREALYSKEASLTKVPNEVSLLATPGTPPAFAGLFLLDLAGAEAEDVALWEEPKDNKTPTFEAVSLSGESAPDPSRGSLLLTTADVPRLIPLVAIAQGGFVASHTEALTAWGRTWLEGEERIRKDAAASARAIAKYQGAPNPLVLINRLGPIGWATLADNARWAGLSGRGAVTLQTLFDRTWRLWRAAGILSTPRPESPCTAPAVIASLVRQLGATDSPKVAPKDKEGDRGPERVLLTYTAPGTKLDESALLAEIGVLAGLFSRSTLRISVRGPRFKKQAASVVEQAQGRFGLDPSRLVAGDKPATRGSAAVDVLAPR
ncbi:MAG: hypothetical protein ACOC1F_02205 [Myxococcota bacterium]